MMRSMNSLALKILPVVAALAVTAPAQAATYRLGALEVRQPWSRPAAAHVTGVGYMTVLNTGAKPDTLTEVTSPIAAKVEIHSSSMAGGVMRMTRLAQVAVPPKGQLAFAPGAYHLMFVGLTRPLKPGDRVPALLTFASGLRLKVDFAVGTGLAPPPETSMQDMPGMEHTAH
jgi:copper(I)-binding protein